MSGAKKAVDSTLRRILNYTAEIIMSIILLVIICIPLAFVIPQWFQTIVFGLPRNQLALDPVHWFGFDGAVWLTLLLGLVSFTLAYAYIIRLKPGTIIEDLPDDEEDEDDEEEDEDQLEVEEVEEDSEEAIENQPEVEVVDELVEEIEEEEEED